MRAHERCLRSRKNTEDPKIEVDGEWRGWDAEVEVRRLEENRSRRRIEEYEVREARRALQSMNVESVSRKKRAKLDFDSRTEEDCGGNQFGKKVEVDVEIKIGNGG